MSLLYTVVGGMIVSSEQQVAVPGLVVSDFYLLQTPGNGRDGIHDSGAEESSVSG